MKQFPIYQNKLSPCTAKDHLNNRGCLANNDIARFIFAITLKEYRLAFNILKETNPFSGGCGRFCDHPCETACNRAKFDSPVDIQLLERFASDYGFKKGILPDKQINKKERIAVIGGGPAGLSSAYFLARSGYSATLFEKHEKAGGMLKEGIPIYRYPDNIYQYEIDYIKESGVKIETKAEIDGKSLKNLQKEFHAVIVASGAHKPKKLGIKGDNLDGVIVGLDFLKTVNLSEEVNKGDIKKLVKKTGIGKKAAVIGGGYTAFDVARSARKLGSEVTIYYRRTVNEMSAHPGEVEELKKEGVNFVLLAAPKEIAKVNGRLKLTLQRMKLAEPDSSGRRKPIPIAGETFETDVDNVITAISEDPDLSFLPEPYSVDRFFLNIDGNKKLNTFITGDALAGRCPETGSVVAAVGSAQGVAKNVIDFLTGKNNNRKEELIAYYNTIQTRYFEVLGRAVVPKIPYKERMGNFNEITQTLSEAAAVDKASRCFFCGICIQCDWCLNYSNTSIAKLVMPWNPEKDAFFYKFLKEKVDRTTVRSVWACPRNAMGVVDETKENQRVIREQYE